MTYPHPLPLRHTNHGATVYVYQITHNTMDNYDAHSNYEHQEHESVTEQEMDAIELAGEGDSYDELTSDLSLSLRLALDGGVSPRKVNDLVHEALAVYERDFINDKRALAVHND